MTRAVLIMVLVSSACVPVVEPFARTVVPRDAGNDDGCAAPGSREAGMHCRCTADCVGDAVCITEELSSYPQGLCSKGCVGGAPCGDGFACWQLSCVLRCDSTVDCRGEAHCVGGKCIPFCDSDDDCLSGNCNRYDGFCLPAGQQPTGLGLDAPCTLDSQCRSNRCVEGHCLTGCSVAANDCPDEGRCDPLQGDLGWCHAKCEQGGACPSADRRCVGLSGEPAFCVPTSNTGCVGRLPSPTTGNNCGCSNDCDAVDAACLREETSGSPHGLCVRQCTNDTQCPATHRCYGGACLIRCTVDDACPVGHLCGFGVCQPYCVLDSECVNGACDRYQGRCAAPLAGTGGIGAPCANDAACRSGNCEPAWPGGWCMTYCSMERGSCPENAVCVRGAPDGDSGYCAKRCTQPSDCQRPNARCIDGHCD